MRTSHAVHVPAEEYLAICEVMARYSSSIDTKDWELFATCWTDDCVATFSGLRYEGLAVLTEALRVMHAPLDGSLHRCGNIVVTSYDKSTAKATSYVHAVMVQAAHPAGADFHMYGYYEDDWVRREGAWRMARRDFSTVWSSGNPGVLDLDPSSVTALRST